MVVVGGYIVILFVKDNIIVIVNFEVMCDIFNIGFNGWIFFGIVVFVYCQEGQDIIFFINEEVEYLFEIYY